MRWIRQALCFLFLASALFLAPNAAGQQVESEYGPLPVFEFHSGFWLNLHHTLYREAKQRAAARSDQGKNTKQPQPTLKTAPQANGALTQAEQQVWNEAVNYYAENFAEKDLLFSTEMIQLKNQLGDLEGCDELSGTKQKICNAGLPA